jgi:hypothetical protein
LGAGSLSCGPAAAATAALVVADFFVFLLQKFREAATYRQMKFVSRFVRVNHEEISIQASLAIAE